MAGTRNTIASLVASAILAAALWLYVSLVRTYEGDVLVPCVAVPPAGQTILSNVPKFISVHVRTSGLNIVNMTYFNKPQTCSLNVSELRTIGPEQYVLSQAEILSKLSDVVSTRMLATIPSDIAITTGTPEVKKVPIVVPHTISVRSGFVLVKPPIAETPLVTLRGMKAVVQSIEQWSTQKIFLEDAHESIVLEVPVADSLASSVDVHPRTIRVKLDVQRQADVEIADVPITPGEGALMQGITLRPATVRVTIRGGVNDVASITRDDLIVDLQGPTSSGYAVPRVRILKNARVVRVWPRAIQIVRSSSK